MWRFCNPVTVVFGDGCLARVGDVLAGRSFALVTYREPLFAKLADRLAAVAGEPLTTIDDIPPNPDFDTLQRCCNHLAGCPTSPEVLVALGGGSVIDTAKVLAASNGTFEPVKRYLETGQGSETLGATPIVAIPTTAGTGSEVTCWATVWDKAGARKHSLSQPGLYPEYALVDPELTYNMPRALTVSTGLDALSHALESIWNRHANPVSTQLAIRAARDIQRDLPLLSSNLSDPALRESLSRAALMAGLAFSNTRTALAHSLSYPITLRHGVPHGLACSFTLPLVMRGTLGADATCDAALAEIFGQDLDAGVRRLAGLLDELQVSRDATSYGMTREEFQGLIVAAFDGQRGRNFIGHQESILAAERDEVA